MTYDKVQKPANRPIPLLRDKFSWYGSPLITSALVFTAVFIALRNGIWAVEDSWAYWEASLSLLEKQRYTYVDGGKILHWPPLYSTYLAIFQYFLGTTGHTLVLASAFLAAVTSALWHVILRKLWTQPNLSSRDSLSYALAIVFTASHIVTNSYVVLAHTLLMLFSGTALLSIFRFIDATDGKKWLWLFTLGASLALCLLSHNLAVCYVPVVAFILLTESSKRDSLLIRLFYGFVLGVISFTPWLLTRIILKQHGSHSIDTPEFSWIEYFWQFLSAFGTAFFPPRPGSLRNIIPYGMVLLTILWSIWVAFIRRDTLPKTLRISVVFGLGLLAGVYMLFNIVWIAAPLQINYILPAPLLIVPVLFYFLGRMNLPLLGGLAVIVLGSKLYIIGLVTVRSTIPTPPSFPARYEEIRSNYFLTSEADKSPPDGVLSIWPADFEWLERYDTKETKREARLVYPR